jgi:maltooligosyltrehalose trehalohydrolase
MNQPQPTRAVPGGTRLPDGSWRFTVWAPSRKQIELHLPGHPKPFRAMQEDAFGYYTVVADDVQAGCKYWYRLDGSVERPDPASRSQPEGVHGPSQLVDLTDFQWTDTNWKGSSLEDAVFYELHVGTFTPEGTLEALIPRLDELVDLGVTTIELMPIAQFPGTRNWGYDGVYPYAVQNSYGGPFQLQKFVNATHSRGLAVALDVVYNHLGPEGNYLREYGPYFTNRYRTPWGAAINFDGAQSDVVRHFFVQNALYWLEHYHIDALRLDAIHGIYDASAFPFLAELSAEVAALSRRLGREIPLIAESDLNDARVLRAAEDGGFGMAGQWSDDFHHAVHALLTGEKSGYYADFGELCQLTATLEQGWYFAGQFSRYRQRKHGNKPPGGKPCRFVVCSQNHDQVGNRALGERLSALTNFEGLKLAAGVTILSSFVPLLFMGEEYGETAHFKYFTSHGDRDLAEAVRRGRNADFEAFDWQVEVPDPQAESTFAASKLNRGLVQEEPHQALLRFYKALLRFRRLHKLGQLAQFSITQFESAKAILVVLGKHSELVAELFHFGDARASLSISFPAGAWETQIDSADPIWLGPGTSAPAKIEGGGKLTLTVPARSLVVWLRSSLRGGD